MQRHEGLEGYVSRMNDETPRLKRRRRRWIIVGVLLLLISFTGWWSRPRVDHRFVGDWAFIPTGRTQPTSLISLSADGDVSSEIGGRPSKSQRWSVYGGRLFLLESGDSLTNISSRAIARFLATITRSDLSGRIECYEIIAVERDEIRIRGATLRRLPE